MARSMVTVSSCHSYIYRIASLVFFILLYFLLVFCNAHANWTCCWRFTFLSPNLFPLLIAKQYPFHAELILHASVFLPSLYLGSDAPVLNWSLSPQRGFQRGFFPFIWLPLGPQELKAWKSHSHSQELWTVAEWCQHSCFAWTGSGREPSKDWYIPSKNIRGHRRMDGVHRLALKLT